MAQWARRKRRTRVTSLQELAWLHREEIEIGEVVKVAACDMGRLQTQLTGLGIGVSTEWQREQIMNENEVWTIERTPGATWIAERVRHLTGEENHGNHHVYVDAEGPDGADLRNTGLNIVYGWDGIRDDEATPIVPINKPEGEFGCNVPIFSDTDMYIGMHGAPSDIVRGLRTDFGDDDGQDGNSWGHQSFHVVFRYQPTQAQPEPQPEPQAVLPAVPPVAEPVEAELADLHGKESALLFTSKPSLPKGPKGPNGKKAPCNGSITLGKAVTCHITPLKSPTRLSHGSSKLTQKQTTPSPTWPAQATIA